MSPVEFVWLIPALPLAVVAVLFFVTRPLDLASRPRVAHAEEHTPTGVESTEEHARTGHGAATHAATAQADQTGGGGHAHGGATPFWARVGSAIGVLAMVAAFALAVAIFIQFLGDEALRHSGYTLRLFEWFRFGNLTYAIDFHVDTLTVVMLLVVTSVSMLVHLYSTGYMAGDPGYSRFFIELALFTFSMLILVLGANLLVLFIGWELVGLSSYLLIGFFYDATPSPNPDVPYPPPAALKAFLTTRLGDFGMLIGLLMLFLTTGTFVFTQLDTATAAYAQTSGANQAVITLAMILIFCGAVGKSAQFPLHVWLPDAMAGPTPVSALIHAATMVAAGVYLVARLFPIYHAAAGPLSLEVVGYVGGFTALFAATIALVQNDIKGVLAYSTISQLGYMFVGLAVADTNAVGIFHLFTHAFFKALLFLGAGSVIHAVAEQDLRRMGGLARALPITAATMLLATLAISGIPPFSGFWSKDAIIAHAYEYGTAHGGNFLLYGMTLFTALLTAFYMFRLFFLAFGGRGGSFGGFWGGRRQYRGEGHPHESPWMMALPLMLLAVPTVLAGFWDLNGAFGGFLAGETAPYANPFGDPLTYVGVGAALVGIALAWLIYGLGILPATLLTKNPLGGFVYRVLKNKYYLDELYAALIRVVVLGLSNLFVLFDRTVIDGVANGSANAVRGLGALTRRTETGRLQNYGVALFGGVLLVMVILFVAVGATGR